jgi:hypothetical protein
MSDVTLIFILGGEEAALNEEEDIEAPTAIMMRIKARMPTPNPHFWA